MRYVPNVQAVVGVDSVPNVSEVPPLRSVPVVPAYGVQGSKFNVFAPRPVSIAKPGYGVFVDS
jgi:hypothetical protein